jgi:hypothetical protein
MTLHVYVRFLAAGLVLVFTAWAVTGCDPVASPPVTFPRFDVNVAEHAPYFLIDPESPHALGAPDQNNVAISCDGCHGGNDSFKNAKCLACHTNDETALGVVHGAVGGYIPNDVNCVTCHPDGLKGANFGNGDHSDIWFPIDADSLHGGAAYTARIDTANGEDQCSACHADQLDRSIVRCAECHAEDTDPTLEAAHFDGLFAGNQGAVNRSTDGRLTESTSCKECHGADVPISNPFMQPISTHIEPGVSIDAGHQGARCTECHTARLAGEKAFALDFTIASCTCCHATTCTPTDQAPCPGTGNTNGGCP